MPPLANRPCSTRKALRQGAISRKSSNGEACCDSSRAEASPNTGGKPWCFTENRIAVRFEYESHDAEGQWWRSHGNELWEFDENGLMRRRDASINDYKIDESERKFRWAR